MRFEVLLRPAGSDGGTDVPIVTFEHQYPDRDRAQYEERRAGPRVDAVRGDLLVLRITVLGPTPDATWIPFAEQPYQPYARWLTLDIP